MVDEESGAEGEDLVPREPTLTDVVALCRELNARDARYVVCGGFAIRAAGYMRRTGDIDLVIDAAIKNEAKVYEALEIFSDKAVRQLDPGDVAKYIVVRIADEVLVDLMRSASGIDYGEASQHVVVREVDGVPIPFASPHLLWRMKRHTHREKDAGDLVFLRELFEANGVAVPD
jgi:hypothetical protein